MPIAIDWTWDEGTGAGPLFWPCLCPWNFDYSVVKLQLIPISCTQIRCKLATISFAARAN